MLDPSVEHRTFTNQFLTGLGLTEGQATFVEIIPGIVVSIPSGLRSLKSGFGFVKGLFSTVDDAADTTRGAVKEVVHAGTAPAINPGYPSKGRTTNCVNCAIATDLTFSGHPVSALPYLGKGKPISTIVAELGGKFFRVSGRSDIEHVLTQLGPGTRVIVYGSRGPGKVGHVFNGVTNSRGIPIFFDGQTMRAASFNGFVEFKILITNIP